MSETIITSIIAAAATLVGSALGAIATIKAARIKTPTAGREQRSGALVHDLRPVFLRSALIWILVSLIVGLVVGLGAQNLRRQIARQVMGDLYHFELLDLISVTEIRDGTVTQPWRPMGKSATTGLSLNSLDSASKRGQDGALRVQVRLDRPGVDYAEVGIDGTDLPEEPVDLIMAWVFVQPTEQSEATRIEARLVGRTRAKDDGVFGAKGRAC